jgi:hypothetical protein
VRAADLLVFHLALPRRTYTQSHVDFVGELIAGEWERADALTGYRIIEQPGPLRHFTARLEPVSTAASGCPTARIGSSHGVTEAAWGRTCQTSPQVRGRADSFASRTAVQRRLCSATAALQVRSV